MSKKIIQNNQTYLCKIYMAPVVQKLDSAIHRINRYPADKQCENQLPYPQDSDSSSGQRYPPFEQPGHGDLVESITMLFVLSLCLCCVSFFFFFKKKKSIEQTILCGPGLNYQQAIWYMLISINVNIYNKKQKLFVFK